MIRQLVFLLFLLSFLDAIGQKSFSSIYGSSSYDLPTCIKQIESSYYLLNFEFNAPYLPAYKAEIIKFNSNGSLVKKNTFFSSGDQYTPLRKIFPINNTEFLLFGGIRESEDSNTQIWVIKIDTSLNIIWEKRFPTDVKYLERMNYTLNINNNLILMVTLSTGSLNFLKSILFLELTLNGDFVWSRHETSGNQNTMMGYSIISHSNGYYAFVDGFSSYLPIPGMGFSERLDLDTNFNITRAQSIPEGMYGYMTAEKINEQFYYLAGKKYYTGFYTENAIQKTDTSNTILFSNHSGLPGNIPDGPAWLECMSVESENIIYTGGIGYDVSSPYECNFLHPQVFILSNYDSLLNNRWTKYYGSDTACYYMMDLDATDDGGCIMAGTILSPNSNPHKTDVIIIKVDSEGLITSTNKPGTRVMQAVVYPNPGNEYLMLQTGQQNMGAIFTLHNLSGQKLMEQTVNSTTQQALTSELPPGNYVWTLSKGNKVIETGKWIKQ